MKKITSLTLTSLFLLTAGFVHAQFVPPKVPFSFVPPDTYISCSLNDPNCGVTPPLFIGDITQKKQGPIIVKKNIVGNPLGTNSWTSQTEYNKNGPLNKKDNFTYGLETNALFGSFEFSGNIQTIIDDLRIPYAEKVVSVQLQNNPFGKVNSPTALCAGGEFGRVEECSSDVFNPLFNGFHYTADARPAPKATISAYPLKVSYNANPAIEKTTVYWSSTGADHCEPIFGKDIATDTANGLRSGAANILMNKSDRRFVIICYNSETGQSSMDSVLVKYDAPNIPKPVVQLFTQDITFEGAVIINWTINQEDCEKMQDKSKCQNVKYPLPQTLTYSVSNNPSYCALKTELFEIGAQNGGNQYLGKWNIPAEDKELFTYTFATDPAILPTATGTHTITVDAEDKYISKYARDSRTGHEYSIECYNSIGEVGKSPTRYINHFFNVN